MTSASKVSVPSTLLCAVQNHSAKVVAVKQAGRPECKVAAQLLMKALAEKNVPFNFVTSKYFQAYVAFVSGLTYRAPSRYNLIASLEQISEIIATKVLKTFTNAAFMGICADSWTSGGRHVTAITAGLPGTSLYLNSYDNLGADDAVTTAAALHECVLVSMQLPRDMDQSNSMYPTGKVCTRCRAFVVCRPHHSHRQPKIDEDRTPHAIAPVEVEHGSTRGQRVPRFNVCQTRRGQLRF